MPKSGAARRRAGRPSAAVLDQAGITAAALRAHRQERLRRPHHGRTGPLTARGAVGPLQPCGIQTGRAAARRRPPRLPWWMCPPSARNRGRTPCGSGPGATGTSSPAHTPLIPVIAVLPVTDAPQTLAMYETVSAGFRDAGFPEERIVSVHRGPGVVHLRLGLRRHGARRTSSTPAAWPKPTPSFTGAVRSLAAQGHEKPADVAFSLGLEALIAGFGALRE